MVWVNRAKGVKPVALEVKVGDRIEERWEVRRVLAGGFGRVYLVIDTQDGTPLAIKTYLNPSLVEPEMIERFRVETELWNQLGSHAHIVHMDSFRILNGLPCLFLEWVEGGDLSEWVGSARLTLETVLRFGLQFCDGMVHAASCGLIAHRDVKPQNCLIDARGWQLKITDFGLAKVVQSALPAPHSDFARWLAEQEKQPAMAATPGLTESGVAMGTMAYMPPEQWLDTASVDVRADIYSFGVMLFELLSGRRPFSGSQVYYLGYQHMMEAPPRLEYPHAMSGRLDDLIQACLAKDKDQRPPNFQEVRAYLAEVYTRATGRPLAPPVTGSQLNANDFNNRAATLLNLGKLPEALYWLERALALQPDLAPAWINRARCLRRMGQSVEAEVACGKALAVADSSDAWSELGMNLSRRGDPRSEECFRRATASDERDPVAWYNLGLFLAGRGQLEEASGCFQRALQLTPRRGEFWVGYGMCLINQGQVERAADCFRQCLELHPDHARAWLYLGEATWELGRREKSRRYFERASQLEPGHPGGWLGLGRCLVDAGHYQQALAPLRRCLDLDPEEALAWKVLGNTQLILGQEDEAVAAFAQAVALDPDDTESWFLRGQLELRQRKSEQAVHSLRQAASRGHQPAAKLLNQVFKGR